MDNVNLMWKNKDKVLLSYEGADRAIWGSLNDVPIQTLYEEGSYGDVSFSANDFLDNMFIKGDNLQSLRSLQEHFFKRIKCIYIDPPFNTGKTFDHYSDALPINIWLSMLKVRIELMRSLLRDDGVIFVHIDDRTMPYVKLLLDDIFNVNESISKKSRSNHVATIIWQKKAVQQNDAKFFSDVHDFILIYAKNIDLLRLNQLDRTMEQDARYKNYDNDPRGPWMSSDLTVKTPNRDWEYEIVLPSGRVVSPSSSRSWGVSKKRFDQLVQDNRIWFGKNDNSMPRLKRFLSEVKPGITPKTIWFRDEVGDNSEGKKELKKLSGIKGDIFTTPKPERLMKKIISIATNEGDWILDAYLGSGTTCAVAHKMKRNWIGLENGQQLEDICIPRLKSIIDGSDNGVVTKLVKWKQGGSFRYFSLK